METFLVVSGYDQRKTKEQIRVRFMTLSELKSLASGQRVEFIGLDGTLRDLRINGQVKRWKRDEDRLEIPVKYGLRECARFSGEEALRRLVVRVELTGDECREILEETFDRT